MFSDRVILFHQHPPLHCCFLISDLQAAEWINEGSLSVYAPTACSPGNSFTHLQVEGGSCSAHQHLLFAPCPVVILLDVLWCPAHPPQIPSAPSFLLWVFPWGFTALLSSSWAAGAGAAVPMEGNGLLVADVKAAEYQGRLCTEQDDQDTFKECPCDLITSSVQQHLGGIPWFSTLCISMGFCWLDLVIPKNETRPGGHDPHLGELSMAPGFTFGAVPHFSTEAAALSRQSPGTATFVGCRCGCRGQPGVVWVCWGGFLGSGLSLCLVRSVQTSSLQQHSFVTVSQSSINISKLWQSTGDFSASPPQQKFRMHTHALLGYNWCYCSTFQILQSNHSCGKRNWWIFNSRRGWAHQQTFNEYQAAFLLLQGCSNTGWPRGGFQDPRHPFRKMGLWYQGTEQSREEGKNWCVEPLLCVQKGACRDTAQGNWGLKQSFLCAGASLAGLVINLYFLKNIKLVFQLAAKNLRCCGSINQFSSVFTTVLKSNVYLIEKKPYKSGNTRLM